MAVLNHLCIGILILQIYVYAAPSDISKKEEITKIETSSENVYPELQEQENNLNTTETTRQKRFFNHFDYGFPPINPVIYPNFRRGDDYVDFGFEDPVAQIYRQVQELAGFVSQSQDFPPSSVFFPVLFVPPFDCNCNPNGYQPSIFPIDQPIDWPFNEPPQTNRPIDRPTYQMNETNDRSIDPEKPGQKSPNVTTSSPPMKDDRRNETGESSNRTPNQAKPEFNRPISFDRVEENQSTERPAPPVEHGTVQSDATANPVPESMVTDPPPSMTENSRPTSTDPPLPTNTIPSAAQVSPVPPPTPCDSAIIACCHQPIVAFDCFAAQGCPDITTSGNPCDTDEILRIIDRLQMYYATRKG